MLLQCDVSSTIFHQSVKVSIPLAVGTIAINFGVEKVGGTITEFQYRKR